MRDFTLASYTSLLQSLLKCGYTFQPLNSYIKKPQIHKTIVLRHDVDKLPQNSLRTALLENELGIKSVYYFRIVAQSYNENVIKQIAELGHEIGYHYEDLSSCNGVYENAIKRFEKNLQKLRQLYPVETICMHGSPYSKYDNKALWNEYSYSQYGIIAEPYFDLNFNDMLYLTDTGRRWDGAAFSVRDKISVDHATMNETKAELKSTIDIMSAAESGFLPDKLMITTHPQRWTDQLIPWTRELVTQNFKNIIKYIIIRSRR